MDILEQIRNSTTYRLYANGSSEDPLSNRGSWIAGIIFRVEKIFILHTHHCSQIITVKQLTVHF